MDLCRAPNPQTCPVRLTQKVLAGTPDAKGTQPMFVFKKDLRPMPVSFIRAQWRKALVASGIPPGMYTLHSLRVAAASAAYHQGCNEREVQHFGKWASDAYKTYIHKDRDNAVSKVLAKTLHLHT